MPVTLRPVLIVGLPRSGTTWQFNVLSKAADTLPVYEPDNQGLNPYGLVFRLSSHRFPQEPDEELRHREQVFWTQIFRGGWKTGYLFRVLKKIYLGNWERIEAQIERSCGQVIPPNPFTRFVDNHALQEPITRTILINPFLRLRAHSNRSGRTVIVKSVHAIRQLEWINRNFNPRMILVTRKLPNLIASYLRLKMPDALRGVIASAPYASQVQRIMDKARPGDESLFHEIIIQACELTRMLLDFQQSNRESILIKHEKACLDPHGHFRTLFSQLELPWNSKVSEYIDSVNKPGAKRENFRIAAQEAHRYQDQLSPGDLEIIRAYAEIYDLAEYS